MTRKPSTKFGTFGFTNGVTHCRDQALRQQTPTRPTRPTASQGGGIPFIVRGEEFFTVRTLLKHRILPQNLPDLVQVSQSQ